MRFVARHIAGALTPALAATVLVILVAAPGAQARGGACDKYGNSQPTQLNKRQARKAILCLLNERRAKAGMPALDRNKKLQRAAQKHSARMSGGNCFDHECTGEADLTARLGNVSYIVGGLLRWVCAENIAWGTRSTGTPRAIVEAWMGSAGHRANILNSDLREVGVGFATGSPTSGDAPAGIYTTDFGFRAG
jgi:uncharacterized protein YkwD